MEREQKPVPLQRGKGTSERWLRWLNLRPEEGERTFLMFAFYTLSSVGILWLEVSVAALFLGEYGVESLPWIYIAGAAIGTGFGFLYAGLQKFLPLRQVIVLTAILMAAPLFLFRWGLHPVLLGGFTIFLMRLWLEAIYVINEINTSITVNQLFTIREIKRTYPLISSGILAADVFSGLSLPPLRSWVGLPNVILLAGVMLCGSAAILLYLTQMYRQFFPEAARRRLNKQPDFTQPRVKGLLRRYVGLVVAFFVLLQVLLLLLDFQYLNQLEQNVSVEKIADFLALFSAGLGVVELATQWFVSGRVIEKFGIFRVALFPPAVLLGLSCLSLTQLVPLLISVTVLKFVDELLRYTLVASTSPILFQPLPEAQRSKVQADVRGIAEPLATGLTGVSMLLIIWLFQRGLPPERAQQWHLIFLFCTALLAALWLVTVKRLRSQYLEVLVLSADWGELSLSQADAQRLKRELEEVLNRSDSDFDKDSYIELLIRTDPKTAAAILAPQLSTLSPELQRQSLEVMLRHPDPAYAGSVQMLLQPPLQPSLTQPTHSEVLSAALRYLWLTAASPNMQPLKVYCQPSVEPAVRSTAAALMLRRGSPQEKSAATDMLRRMLTHKQEQERIMGCRALAGVDYLQSLRLYIKPLLQDPSLQVRCAVLEAIAATHVDEYYPALLRGLYYKSTRQAAQRALVCLENEALPLLSDLAEDSYKPTIVRSQAWNTIGQIGTPEAIDLLVTRLTTSWGATRKKLLQVLLKLPQEKGIDAVADQLGRSGIETLITQELQFLAQIYAARLDLATAETNLLQRALRDSEDDAIERLFLLMQFLYDAAKIRAAAFNLQSESREDRARGLEILDNTLDISKKQILLNVLDAVAEAEKLHYLAEIVSYRPMQPSQRLRYLIELRHFLSDWVIACCFDLACRCRWSLTAEQTLTCLKSPTGFVREAVLVYLRLASPKALRKVLPTLIDDADPLVFAQVCQIMAELGLDLPAKPTRLPAADSDLDATGLELI